MALVIQKSCRWIIYKVYLINYWSIIIKRKSLAKIPKKIKFRNNFLSSNAEATYTIAIRQFYGYLKENNLQLNQDSLTSYLKKLKFDYKPATYNLRRQAIKEHLLEVLKNEYSQTFGLLQLFKKHREIKIKNSILTDRYLTKTQIDIVTQHLLNESFGGSHRVALIIQSLFWTGLRISELINIKLTDIKKDKQVVKISVVGKRNKAHTVYLPKGLYQDIRKVFNSKYYLFETSTGSQYTRINASRDIKFKLRKYGFEVSAHTFRHSKAMYLKNERNLSADVIAKALNHASVATTLNSYFHNEPSPEVMGLYSEYMDLQI